MGHETIVKLLIAAGADLNTRNNDGYTALIAAAYSGHEDITIAIRDAGGDMDVKDSNGMTAYLWALHMGYKNIEKCLLEKAYSGLEANSSPTS